MHLIAQQTVPDLTKLELGEVRLFSGDSKSVSLVIKEDGAPLIAVKVKKETHYFTLNERAKAQELFDKANVITEEVCNNPEKFIEFIKTCDAGVRYRYFDGRRAIEIENDGDGGTYYWSYSDGFRHSYPLAAANRIKTFKTDRGARLSLIKYLRLEENT
jgi:hypothetical protein